MPEEGAGPDGAGEATGAPAPGEAGRPPGAPPTVEVPCRDCGGTGLKDARACPTCGGTGRARVIAPG